MKLCLPFGLLVVLPSLTMGQAPTAQPAAVKPGAPPVNQEQPETVKLVLHSAAEPRAALKHQLLPTLLDRKPGNAAVQYGKAAVLLADISGRDKAMEKISQWLSMPLDKLPREEANKELLAFKNVLAQVELAARREQCDWELLFREQNPIAMLLPELQKLRDFGRLLALQARLQTAEGRFTDALQSLQTGYALGRHAGQGQTLIHALVGMAVCQMMSDRVQEMVQQRAAPNLYWALTALPRPLVSLRAGIEGEMNLVWLSFPYLQVGNEQRNDLAYWQQLLDRTEETTVGAVGFSPPKLGWRAVATVLALKGYPTAKRVMIEQGYSAKEVDEMPVPKVVMLSTLWTYNELRDRMFKWFFVPYWEARAGIAEAERYLHSEGRSREVVPLASLLLPACGSACFAEARNERRIALLRTIEALRIYGAAHQGRLPEKLADITAVPVPIDPTTGQAFSYHKTGETAVLESPAPPGRSPRSDAVRIEIHFK
jgi:hypothetical protein